MPSDLSDDIPQSPLSRLVHVDGAEYPVGDTHPMPVTTTLFNIT